MTSSQQQKKTSALALNVMPGHRALSLFFCWPWRCACLPTHGNLIGEKFVLHAFNSGATPKTRPLILRRAAALRPPNNKINLPYLTPLYSACVSGAAAIMIEIEFEY